MTAVARCTPVPGAPRIAPTDGELLGLFTKQGDREAFDRLLQRHGAMVWGVCRQQLRRAEDAEDAFQATFLQLIKCAAQIKASDSAAGWLYRVAYRTSIRARKALATRREEVLAVDPTSPAEEAFPDLLKRQTSGVLVEELMRLPAKYQTPLVMRYLEGQSRRAIADQTDTTIAAVQGRLSRGKQLLRRRLLRRGVSLSAAMAAIGLGGREAQAAAPAHVVAQTATHGTALAAGGSLAASAAVTLLYQQGVRSMLLASLSKPAAATAAVALVALFCFAPGGAQQAASASLPVLDATLSDNEPAESAAPIQLAQATPPADAEGSSVYAEVYYVADLLRPRVDGSDVESPEAAVKRLAAEFREAFPLGLDIREFPQNLSLVVGADQSHHEAFADYLAIRRREAGVDDASRFVVAEAPAKQSELIDPLEELVKALEEARALTESLRVEGAIGGDDVNTTRARHALADAKAQLAVARGDTDQARKHYAEAIKHADQAVNAEVAAYQAGRRTLADTLEAYRLRAEAKVALARLAAGDEDLPGAEVSSQATDEPEPTNGRVSEYWPDGSTKAKRTYRDGRLAAAVEYAQDGTVLEKYSDDGERPAGEMATPAKPIKLDGEMRVKLDEPAVLEAVEEDGRRVRLRYKPAGDGKTATIVLEASESASKGDAEPDAAVNEPEKESKPAPSLRELQAQLRQINSAQRQLYQATGDDRIREERKKVEAGGESLLVQSFEEMTRAQDELVTAIAKRQIQESRAVIAQARAMLGQQAPAAERSILQTPTVTAALGETAEVVLPNAAGPVHATASTTEDGETTLDVQQEVAAEPQPKPSVDDALKELEKLTGEVYEAERGTQHILNRAFDLFDFNRKALLNAVFQESLPTPSWAEIQSHANPQPLERLLWTKAQQARKKNFGLVAKIKQRSEELLARIESGDESLERLDRLSGVVMHVQKFDDRSGEEEPGDQTAFAERWNRLCFEKAAGWISAAVGKGKTFVSRSESVKDLQKFQRDNGLEPTGELNEATWNTLFGLSEPKQEASASSSQSKRPRAKNASAADLAALLTELTGIDDPEPFIFNAKSNVTGFLQQFLEHEERRDALAKQLKNFQGDARGLAQKARELAIADERLRMAEACVEQEKNRIVAKEELEKITNPIMNRAYGHSVEILQQTLNERLDGADLAIDSNYGRPTAAAVARFQRGAKLPATGFADAATREKLGLTDPPVELLLHNNEHPSEGYPSLFGLISRVHRLRNLIEDDLRKEVHAQWSQQQPDAEAIRKQFELARLQAEFKGINEALASLGFDEPIHYDLNESLIEETGVAKSQPVSQQVPVAQKKSGRWNCHHVPTALNSAGWATVAELQVGAQAPIKLPGDKRPRPHMRLEAVEAGVARFRIIDPGFPQHEAPWDGAKPLTIRGVPTEAIVLGPGERDETHLMVIRGHTTDQDVAIPTIEEAKRLLRRNASQIEAAKRLLRDEAIRDEILAELAPKADSSQAARESSIRQKILSQLAFVPGVLVQVSVSRLEGGVEADASIVVPLSYVEAVCRQENPESKAIDPAKLAAKREELKDTIEKIVEPLLPRLPLAEGPFRQTSVAFIRDVPERRDGAVSEAKEPAAASDSVAEPPSREQLLDHYRPLAENLRETLSDIEGLKAWAAVGTKEPLEVELSLAVSSELAERAFRKQNPGVTPRPEHRLGAEQVVREEILGRVAPLVEQFPKLGEERRVAKVFFFARNGPVPFNPGVTMNSEPVGKRPAGRVDYTDGKADGKKSLGGSGHLIRFELPEGTAGVKHLRLHGSRYGTKSAPREDFEISFLSEDRSEILAVRRGAYGLFRRGAEKWTTVRFDRPVVDLPETFWVAVDFSPGRTKGIYLSYDTSTDGERSMTGLAQDEPAEHKRVEFGGDWMVALILERGDGAAAAKPSDKATVESPSEPYPGFRKTTIDGLVKDPYGPKLRPDDAALLVDLMLEEWRATGSFDRFEGETLEGLWDLIRMRLGDDHERFERIKSALLAAEGAEGGGGAPRSGSPRAEETAQDGQIKPGDTLLLQQKIRHGEEGLLLVDNLLKVQLDGQVDLPIGSALQVAGEIPETVARVLDARVEQAKAKNPNDRSNMEYLSCECRLVDPDRFDPLAEEYFGFAVEPADDRPLEVGERLAVRWVYSGEGERQVGSAKLTAVNAEGKLTELSDAPILAEGMRIATVEAILNDIARGAEGQAGFPAVTKVRVRRLAADAERGEGAAQSGSPRAEATAQLPEVSDRDPRAAGALRDEVRERYEAARKKLEEQSERSNQIAEEFEKRIVWERSLAVAKSTEAGPSPGADTPEGIASFNRELFERVRAGLREQMHDTRELFDLKSEALMAEAKGDEPAADKARERLRAKREEVQKRTEQLDKDRDLLKRRLKGLPDGKPDGEVVLLGKSHLVRLERYGGVSAGVKSLRLHSSRRWNPKDQREDVEIAFLSEDRSEVLATRSAPYSPFRLKPQKWTTLRFDEPVTGLPETFWVALNLNPKRTAGICLSYDTATGGARSLVGVVGEPPEQHQPVAEAGDWMVRLEWEGVQPSSPEEYAYAVMNREYDWKIQQQIARAVMLEDHAEAERLRGYLIGDRLKDLKPPSRVESLRSALQGADQALADAEHEGDSKTRSLLLRARRDIEEELVEALAEQNSSAGGGDAPQSKAPSNGVGAALSPGEESV